MTLHVPRIAFFATATLLFLGGGCATDALSDTPENMTPRVVFSEDHYDAGGVTLTFTLYGANNHVLTDADLQVAHEKLVHLIVVRNDMQGYQHLHPAFTDGMWTVATAFTDEGTYSAYVDIVPKGGDAVVLHDTLQVGDASTSSVFPLPMTTASTDGITVALAASSDYASGTPLTLTFTLRRENAPVAIDPYLDAYGHVVALRHGDPDAYLHLHPLTETAPTDGTVDFTTTFPEPGAYTLFAQFAVDGTVRTFPLTTDVSIGATAASPDEGHYMH